jgi:ATP-dependent Lhr-like helicase
MNGSAGHIHNEVRKRMFEIYRNRKVPVYLNKVAAKHVQQGIEQFERMHLEHSHIYDGPTGIALFPWQGDKVIRTIVLMLKKESIDASAYKSHIELAYTPKDSLKVAVYNILNYENISGTDLIKKVNNLDREKHDSYISMDLKRMSFAHSELDIEGALDFFAVLRKEL